jgi:hypothetical protein
VNSSTASVTSVPLVDTTLTLVAGTYYTILHAGNSRAANGAATADRLILIDDTRPAQNAGYHVSTMNTSTAAIDVWMADSAAADTVPTVWTVTNANVAYGNRSTYTARAVTSRAALRATPTGSAVASARSLGLLGAAGTVAADPIGGTNVAGTQFSVFFFPASVAGSPAASFASPGLSFFVDRQPPRTVPD